MKLSLIIPTIGTSPFLKEAVRSALEQTVPFEEIVLFGNGLSEETLVRDLGTDLSAGIRIVTQPERVPPHLSWNRAVESSSLSHFMFLGDDDVLLPEAHARARELLKRSSMATLGFEIINTNGKVYERSVSPFTDSTPENFYHRLYTGEISLMISGVAIERVLFTKAGGFQSTPFSSGWFIDTDCWTRIAFAAGGVSHSDTADWQYRINAGQLGFKTGIDKFANELSKYVPYHKAWAASLGIPQEKILGGNETAYCERLLRIRALCSITNQLMNGRLPSWQILHELFTSKSLPLKTRGKVLWRSLRFGLSRLKHR